MSVISSSDMVMLGNRRGRPVRAEATSIKHQIRFSPAELHRVKIAASLNYQTPSQFIRDAVVTAAEDCLENVE